MAQRRPNCPLPADPVVAIAPPAAAVNAGPLEVKWQELEIPLSPEEDFEPWMLSTSIKSLDGLQVRITGYMHEGVLQKDHIREFVLVKHIGCQFGAEGQPQHVAMVTLQGKLRTALTTDPVTVQGTFHVEPYVGPDQRVWALYRVEATQDRERDAMSQQTLLWLTSLTLAGLAAVPAAGTSRLPALARNRS